MVLFICGKGGSGKDTLLQSIVKDTGFKRVVLYTTRPKRFGEIDGVDYNFLSNLEFFKLLLNREVLSSYQYKVSDKPKVVWRYAVPNFLEDKTIDCIIEGPLKLYRDICHKCHINNKEIVGVYLNTSSYVCLTRMMNRCNHTEDASVIETCRRVYSDSQEYSNIRLNEFDLVINNDKLSVEQEKQLVLDKIRY